MGELTITCPHCNTQLTADEQYVGSQVACPSCGQIFTIPAPQPVVVQPRIVQPQPKIVQPQPRIAQPQYDQTPQYDPQLPDEWIISEEQLKSIRTCTLWYWISAIAIVVCCGLGAIPMAVFGFILLYKYWKLVPYAEAETTPGKAVGFCFIPFFSLYWIFVAKYKLAKHYSAFIPGMEKLALGSVICGWAGTALWWIICMPLTLLVILTESDALAGIKIFFELVSYAIWLAQLILEIVWLLRMQKCAEMLPRRA